jgi:hypothetical protein
VAGEHTFGLYQGTASAVPQEKPVHDKGFLE